jgi:pimeloyl-ACP methyl ester carboxylesterase
VLKKSRLDFDSQRIYHQMAGSNLMARLLATVLFGIRLAMPQPQAPAESAVDEKLLREYTGVYQWEKSGFVYLQMWDEFSGSGKPKLVSFDESGLVRTLYPTARDQFFAGPGAAVPSSIESRVEFQRDGAGRIRSLTWRREASARVGQRIEIEKREDVRFLSSDVQLTGTVISPNTGGRHPAIVLVHGSGAENREYMLPWARFLIRRGIAVLGYDKRGVGGSTGDWNTASFDDSASDVIAAVGYLKTRSDIDRNQIGLLGISQAGWVMPLAAVRSKDIAFLISISGAGVPAAETTIDQTRNEMTMAGVPRENVEAIIALLTLQYEFARTGQGWEEYAAAREKLATRMGKPPDTIPGILDHPYWQFIKRLYFYDPVPTLRQLRTPTLAIWGELDNNIMAEKNKVAWEAALKTAGNRDYTLRILPNANHAQFEAKIGSNAEAPKLQRIVPAYFSTIQDWLAKRVRGFQASR